MLDQANRTFICSVVFIDLVGYSKKPVTEQIRLKTSLTNNLSEAIKDIPVNDRIILDTGDGAAISFLGDPEDALFTTLSLREAMVREGMSATMVEASGEDAVRMGINLGPVKLVKDINGHPNIIGDGINVAQRIMSFARPGQIVVSRSYYDVVSNLASEYAKLFHYEGSRTDKHVREHEIYVVGHHEGALQKAKAGMKDRAATTSTNVAKVGTATGTSTVTLTIPNFAQDKKKLALIAGALGVVVLVLAVLVATKRSEQPAVAATTPPKLAEASKTDNPATDTKPESKGDPASGEPAKGDAPKGDAPKTDIPKAEPPKTDSPRTDAAKPDTPKTDAPKSEAPKTDATKADSPKTAATPGKGEPAKGEASGLPPATVAFSIQPWGEVFVNGKLRGVYPPLKPIQLSPGKYKIEVKNTTFPALVVNVDLKARDEITVRHKFQ